MIKFLIIFGIIFIIILIVVGRIRKKIENIFQSFAPNPNIRKNEKDTVIYEKDDVVVLKGEARDENEEV